MPRSSPRLCAQCGAHVYGRCPTCSSGWSQGRKGKAWADDKADGARWRRFRQAYLKTNPLCQWPGCDELASQLDHVDGTDYDTQRYDWAMVRGLCAKHHRQRTTMQGNAAQGRG